MATIILHHHLLLLLLLLLLLFLLDACGERLRERERLILESVFTTS